MTNDASLMLDVGGHACRALAVDRHGHIVHEASREIASDEQSDRVEQDAAELVRALSDAVAEACEQVAGRYGRVTRAALAVQRGSIVCWDQGDGTALSPVISWRDRRSLAGMERLADHADEIRRRTGLRFSPYGGASKLAWCLGALPAAARAADERRLACGPLGSFLLARLLEEHPLRVDDTLAQRTLLWSRESLDWDPWLLERFGIPCRILPEVTASRSAHGHLSCPAGAVPLELLMGDQNCLPWMDGKPDPDTLYVNLGTGAFVLRPLAEPVDDPRFQLTLLDRAGGGRWALEASVHGSASAIAWFERTQACRVDYERIDSIRERIEHPPLFMNSVDGLGSPWWQTGPEPGFIGDHTAGDPDARLLAVLESIAFLVCACAEAMNERVGPPTRVVLAGGLSRSAALCSLIAEALQTDAQRLDSAEGTALGLWCRLHGRALPPQRFEPVARGDGDRLRERYAAWLEQVERALC